MSSKKTIFFTLYLLAALVLSGCIEDKTAPTSDVTPQEVSVSVSPSVTTLPTGGTQSFLASVTGTGNKAVNWSIQEGSSGGTILKSISTGINGNYTAPISGGTFHVVATTSQVDTQKSATATVTVSTSLDDGFGTNGKTSTSFGGIDTINALVTQADGKIVVGGSSLNGAETDFTLARYNSNGSLDSTFGKDGIVVTSLGSSSEINALVIQSDGKILAGGNSSNLENSNFALARYQSNGSLDTTFGPGATGIVITRVGVTDDQLNALALQSDGMIVAGGFSFVPDGDQITIGKNKFALVRVQSNGTLDTTFGTNGIVTTSFGTNEAGKIHALVIQKSDQKIIAGGFSSQGANDFALVRYDKFGIPDSTFGTSGIVKTPIGTGDDQIHALVLQSDEMIIAAGHSFMSGNNDFALARYKTDGSPDTSFDTDGEVTTQIGTSTDEIKAIAIQSDGKIVVGGFSSNGANNDFALARYNTDGSLDTNADADPGVHFNTTGKVTTPIGTGIDEIKAIAIQSNLIIAGGFSVKGMRRDFALVRYDAAGNLDTTFDTDGKVTTAVGGGSDEINAVALQSDGKIVVAGFSFGVNNIKNNDFSLARYNTDGSLDTTSFGTAGKVTTPIGSGNNEINAMAIQSSDDKIVVAGTAFFVTGNGPHNDFALARYSASGVLDTAGFSGGTVTTSTNFDTAAGTNTGTGNSEIHAIALQSDEKIVVAGTAFTGTNNDFALARYSTNGALDTANFGTAGKVTTQIVNGKIVTDPSLIGSSFAEAMAIQKVDDKIVVAGMSSVKNTITGESDLDFTLVRYQSNGSSPDTSFGTDGIVTTAIGTGHDVVTAMMIQTDGKIIVAGTTLSGDSPEQFVLVRYNTDGKLDTSFNTTGIVKTLIGEGSRPLALAIQTDGKIVAGGYSTSVTNSRDFTLVRYLSDGTLDTSFGVGGIEISPFSAQVDEIHGLVVSSGKILAAGIITMGNGEDTDFHLAQYKAP